MTPSVLVIEDESNIRELVALHLRLEEMTPIEAPDGNVGLEQARNKRFDLVILDLMLPGLDGVTLCRAIRRDSQNAETPILMLTARREEADKVLGLDSCADDYLTKPFGIRELTARVRALLRRRAARLERIAHATPVTAAGLTVDPSRRMARLADRDVELTAHEFDLLYVLATNRGIVFSREALLQRVWGNDTHITVRSVDTLVKRLRKKVEVEAADPRVILTVWGAGYKFTDA